MIKKIFKRPARFKPKACINKASNHKISTNIAAFVATLGLSTALVSSTTLAATTADHDKEVIGYITQWDPWKDGKAGFPAKGAANHLNVDMSKYTILNFSFFGVAVDGSLHSGDYRNKNIYQQGTVQSPAPLLYTDVYSSWDLFLLWGELDPVHYLTDEAAAEAGFSIEGTNWTHLETGISGPFPIPLKKEGGQPGLIERAHANGVKVMASIGGWSMCRHFPEMAADPVKRAKFMEGVRQLMDLGFDGIDLDWEYPGPFAGMNFTGTEADYDNFLTLVKEIRAEIGPDKLITSAFSADVRKLEGFDWDELNKYMDSYNMMTYDFNGGWSNKAGHNSPLYDYTDSDYFAFNWDHLAQWMLDRGIPSEKINMGAAFYGRGVVTEKPAALNQATIKQDITLQPDGPISNAGDFTHWPLDVYDATPNYFFIEQNKAGWTEHWDDEAKVPYLTKDGNTGFFLSYDNEESIGLKAEYINDNALGGVIVWQVAGDFECVGGHTMAGKMPVCAGVNPKLANKMNDVFAEGCTGCPTVRITSPSNTDHFAPGDNVMIQVNARDVDGTVDRVDYYANGQMIGSANSGDFSFNWIDVAEGEYEVYAHAYDNDGNDRKSANRMVKVNYEHLMPNVEITAPETMIIQDPLAGISIAATADYESGSVTNVSMKVGMMDLSVSSSGTSHTASYTPRRYGSHTLTVSATSSDGYTMEKTMNFMVAKCTGEQWDANTVYTTQEVLFEGSIYRAKWWNKGQEPDTGGAWTFVKECEVIVENQAPDVAITSPTDGMTYSRGDNVNVSAIAEDDEAVTSVTFYANDMMISTDNTAPYEATIMNVQQGSLVIRAVATDNTGLTGDSMTTVSVLGDGQPPQVSLSASPNGTIEPGTAVSLSATASDADGTVTSVSFSVNGSNISTDTSAPYSASWTPSAEGTYTLVATATDNDNNTASSSVTITVESQDTCTVPAWDANTVYSAGGTRVSKDGNVYSNKWWVQGQDPSASDDPWYVWTNHGPCTE